MTDQTTGGRASMTDRSMKPWLRSAALAVLAFVGLILLAASWGCATTPRPRPPVPTTPPVGDVSVSLTITVQDARTRQPLEHVAVTCLAGTGESDGFGRFFLVGQEGRQEDCRFELGGFRTVTASWLPGPDHGDVAPVLMERDVPPLLPLRVDASRHWFATDAGLFDYREASQFSLQSRMLRGEGESNVRPLLKLWRAEQITATRVLATLGGDYWDQHTPIGYSLRSCPDMPDYLPQLDALIDMHAQEGLYVRLTILGALECFGGVWDPIARRDIFQGDVRRRAEAFALELAAHVANRDNVLLELANEPAAIGMQSSSQALADLGCRVKAAAPRLLLNAGDIQGMEPAAFFSRCFDFVDEHLPRDSEIRFLVGVKRMGENVARDLDGLGGTKPAVSGEPFNMGELRVDGRNGDVATYPIAAYAYGAVMRARQIIPNFHFDGGLWTTWPKPETLASLRAFTRALDAFPMVTGNRWRGGWSPDQGNYWRRDIYPDTDDPGTVERFVRDGRGVFRVFGVGDWSVAFPAIKGWDMRRGLDAPAEQIDRFEDDTFVVAIYRRSRSTHVLPGSAVDDRADVASGHAERGGEVGMRFSERSPFSDGYDDVAGQFATSHYFAADVSSLRHRVQDVVGRSSQEQVIWPDARRVVARMTEKQTARDWAAMNLPARPLRIYVPGVATASADSAISIGVAAASPQPATVGLLNLRPEALGDRLVRVGDRRGPRAALAAKPSLSWPEWRTTKFAIDARHVLNFTTFRRGRVLVGAIQ